MRALLGNPALNPTPADLELSAAHLVDMSAIRSSMPLFRLQSEADAMGRLNFHDTGPDQARGMR